MEANLLDNQSFIGRIKDLEELDLQWKKCKIFGIYGIRAVGKSRLVRQFLKEKGIAPLYLDISTIHDVGSLASAVCACLGLQPEEDGTDPPIWIQQVTKELARNKDKTVLLFDNVEDAVEGDFKDTILLLFASIARRCSAVKVMITSDTRLLFIQLGKVYYMHELQPLDESQSLQLLHSVAPNVDLSYFGSAIAKLSEGLPLLILIIGFEIKAGLISAERMIELLLVTRLQTLGSNSLPLRYPGKL
jgi:hypothetical protein